MTVRHAILMLLLPCLLHSEDTEKYFQNSNSETLHTILTDINAEPSSVVAGCVNASTGDYIEFETDLTIPGPEPFQIQRSYSSGDISDTLLKRGWHLNHKGRLKLDFMRNSKKQTISAYYSGCLGERMSFEGKGTRDIDTFEMEPVPKMFENGLTNTSKGIISGQTHPNNQRVYFDNKKRKTCRLILGSNERLTFTRYNDEHLYLIKDVEKPNGMKFCYSHHDLRLRKIEQRNRVGECVSYAYIHRNLSNEDTDTTVSASISSPDGRIVQYKFNKNAKKCPWFVLTDVIRSNGPPIHYELEEAHNKENKHDKLTGYIEQIKRKELPDGRCIEVDYYRKGDNVVNGYNFKIKDYKHNKLNRVKEIKQPVGVDQQLVTTYKFWYDVQSGPTAIKTTMAFDAYNRRTDYVFSAQDRLIRLLRYNEHGQQYACEHLYWENGPTKNQINLKARVFGRADSNEMAFARHFHYDGYGNILLEELFGNLTGVEGKPLVVNELGIPHPTGVESKITSYTYTGAHLVAKKKEGNITISYDYVPNTNLKSLEFYYDSQGLYRRQFYDYDENSQVVLHQSDDGSSIDRNSMEGVTERVISRITRSKQYPVGLPIKEEKFIVDPGSGQEYLVNYRIQHFDGLGRMVRQEIYGSDGAFAYAKEWEYDEFGNMIRETNPLGHTIYRQYDANGNCIKEEGPLPGVIKEMVYDYMNRLIALHEHHDDGIILTQSFTYDLLGNKTSSVDAFGNVTSYQYDAFGRLIAETAPSIPSPEGGMLSASVKTEYNELSQPVKQTDAYGRSVLTKFTLFGKPYDVQYPDGNSERMQYNLQGQLVERRSPTGSITRYVRDDRGRVVRTEIYNSDGQLYSKAENVYDKTRLLQEISPLGSITKYEYDLMGRVCKILKEDECIEYQYDSIGRRVSTLKTNPDRTEGTLTLQKLDAVGQVLEVTVQDISGVIYSHSTFTYDEAGRKVVANIGGAISTFKYDSQGVCRESTDPDGHKTTLSADYNHYNSYGQHVLKTISTDANGVSTITCYNARGQKHSQDVLDLQGNTLRSELFFYDLNGKLIQSITTPEPARTYHYKYDAMNRLIELVHGYGTLEQKTFTTTYNSYGLKESVLKPDGVVLNFEYDGLGRLISCSSSDGTVSDHYTYDVNNNPIEVTNEVTGKKSLRVFDSDGCILEEINQNGLKTAFEYTYDGSMSKITLPDGSSVNYAYQAGYLKKASRFDAQGNEKYSHLINEYDGLGNIISETLPKDLGKIERRFSSRGDLLACNSPYFNETAAAYDPVGNLISRNVNDSKGSYNDQFSYDSLYQLKEEKGHQEHTYQHDCHQNRLSKDGNEYSVNILNQILSTGTDSLTYDLNGNLLSFGNTLCQYDALDRLTQVSKDGVIATYQYDELNRCISRSSGSTTHRFFYITQAEVGSCDATGKIKELQIVGPGRASAPCQALSIELDGEAYATLHDQSGHLRTLVHHNKKSKTSYRYSSFGEQERFGSTVSPWTFAGKRQDPLTSWLLFGRRFYIPTIGRFLTPDPAGLSASPNLYAYLANSPLVRYDTYGLFESNPFSGLWNLASRTAQIASRIITAPAIAANNVRKLAGHLIFDISRNVVPVAYLQDIPQAVGYFLAHSTLRDYTPSWKEPIFDVVEGDGIDDPTRNNTGVAGIGTTRESAQEYQKELQAANGGYKTDVIYGPTHGFARDIVECILQKLGVRTALVEAAEKHLHNAVDSVGPTGVAKLDAHSRGGITLACVIPTMTHDQISRLWINTYGTGSIIDNKHAMYCMNHINSYEWITLIADPFSTVQAMFKPQTHVRFIPSSSFPGEHGVLEDSYKKAFYEAGYNFRNNNNNKR